MCKIHEIEILPRHFNEKFQGRMLFELKYNDSDFKVGDQIRYYEMTLSKAFEKDFFTLDNIATFVRSGREIVTEIIFILKHLNGLQEGYVILGEKIINKLDSE